MNNNDILRRIRYTFNYEDAKMIALFKLGEYDVSRSMVSNWLKSDTDDDFVAISDQEFAAFLNGLIIDKRGKKEGETPVAETVLNNNIIFRKLKIALNLKGEDILNILKKSGYSISEHELSAFFRHPKQPKFRPCNDQYLRNFLTALQDTYRK